MATTLCEAMREMTAGWKDDLPPDWRLVMQDVETGADDIDPHLQLEAWEPIFPARKGRSFPGAPEGAHMLRAFDAVRADAVRVVLLGQDPYPDPAASTGRAFEIGNALVWRDLERMFSKSIRAFTLMLMAARYDRPELTHSFSAWSTMLAEIESGSLQIEDPADMADRQERAGVLLLNSALTLSRFQRDVDPHQGRGHVLFWRPVIRAALRHIASQDRPVVFVAFGQAAADNLEHAGCLPAPAPHLSLVLPHPAFAEEFLACANPFLAANAHLQRMGAQPIAW
ncbi:uracil-DNA glycosylase family protein [Pseudohoeflea coraliihabitans]|uniref:Uracil-DNA glycosylase n=1 Tax=Pseudohoeflea coraliihabitans TaxID=2860393 RepID=A0ABS6WJ50_9HYPH|nr:uracil-DNA glycosylase family protein [Pseudohoeflea sp. DP4N28-3]MBW3095968.1 uracil-DNA glycosylase [Pseudohoeflea sp. DP4N28-3]